MALVFKCDRCGAVDVKRGASVKVNAEITVEVCKRCEEDIRDVIQRRPPVAANRSMRLKE